MVVFSISNDQVWVAGFDELKVDVSKSGNALTMH